MCHVQRVTNSCGHINDHVLMPCYHAKDVPESPSPSPSPSSSASCTATIPQKSCAQAQDKSEFVDGKPKDEEDMIQRSGFDARTQPYCKLRLPKVLASPRGFECMVSRCGVAD